MASKSCEHKWQKLCEKDGVPCPGKSLCRHMEQELVPVILKSGVKIVRKKRRGFRPL